MRTIAVLLSVVFLAVSASAGPVIPPMPVMPEGSPDAFAVLRDCPRVVRLAYDTPETKAKDYYDSVFWSISGEVRRPFVAAKFTDSNEFQLWVDLNRDGVAEEYYRDYESYIERYPGNNFCTDIFSRVT